MQILRAENDKWSKIMDLTDSLLPWLDYDLWKQLKEKEEENKVENPYYDQQMANMRAGAWNTDPNSFDDLTVSESALNSLKNMTGDNPVSGMPDMPGTYEEFLENLPGGTVPLDDFDKDI